MLSDLRMLGFEDKKDSYGNVGPGFLTGAEFFYSFFSFFGGGGTLFLPMLFLSFYLLFPSFLSRPLSLSISLYLSISISLALSLALSLRRFSALIADRADNLFEKWHMWNFIYMTPNELN